jgi:predicted component of type VI protein secretion system
VKSGHAHLVLLVATTLVVAACSSNKHDTPTPPANAAPTISAVADKNSPQDTVVGPIDFSVADAESTSRELTVTAVADGTSLFPADGVVLGGDDSARTLTLTPLEAATGTANITLSVVDTQGVTTTRTFMVTVTAQNASVKDTTLDTYAKGESAEPTPLNGFTFQQDADDPATFDAQVGTGD